MGKFVLILTCLEEKKIFGTMKEKNQSLGECFFIVFT